MTEQVELRINNPTVTRDAFIASGATAEPVPTLVYLPGMHGDWTLIGNFRRALRGRVRFVEITYPRTVTWTLEDYAAGVEAALAAHGIDQGWILSESFGSQVAWPLVTRKSFRAEGLVLAGGFVRHPVSLAVRIAERLAGRVPLRLITAMLFGYAKIARWRYRRSPEVRQEVAEFLARRTQEDRRAATHRLHLIACNDPCALARQVTVPVFAITGLWDPVVPWPPVRRWLRRHCPALRAHRVVRQSDHNVLGNASGIAAEQVLAWIHSGRHATNTPG